MARDPKPPHVGTLGSTIRVGYSMMIHCGNWDCHHRATVDLEALQARLSADYPVADLVARAVCSECGARWPKISITVHPEAPKVISERDGRNLFERPRACGGERDFEAALS
jgi:hypothetical protein